MHLSPGGRRSRAAHIHQLFEQTFLQERRRLYWLKAHRRKLFWAQYACPCSYTVGQVFDILLGTPFFLEIGGIMDYWQKVLYFRSEHDLCAPLHTPFHFAPWHVSASTAS